METINKQKYRFVAIIAKHLILSHAITLFSHFDFTLLATHLAKQNIDNARKVFEIRRSGRKCFHFALFLFSSESIFGFTVYFFFLHEALIYIAIHKKKKKRKTMNKSEKMSKSEQKFCNN